MKLYVSGPMTGLPEFNHPAFHDATAKLRALGHTVINPAEAFDGDVTKSYGEYMRFHIANILTVDALVMLPGWEASRGARIETGVAGAIEIPTFSLAAMLASKYGGTLAATPQPAQRGEARS